MRLSTRIALSVAATVPLLVLGTNWLLLSWFAGDLHTQQDRQLRSRATIISHNAQAYLQAVEADHPAIARNARRRLIASALDIGIRLDGPEGVITSGPQPGAALLPAEAAGPVTVGTDDSHATDWLVMSRRVTPPNGSAPDRPNLWMFSADTAYRAQLSLIRERMVSVTLLSAPVTGLTAWIVATRATRPLRRLQHRTNGLDPRITSVRLDHTPTRVAEVDDLARTLETVLARYDEQAARTREALETARSFAATASHELRTPLMSMRTNLDILAAHPRLEAADRAEVLDDLGREHARLLGLLVMLRVLAQGDLVEADSFTPVDLAEVVEEAVTGLLRTHPGAEVSVRVTAGLLVHAWEGGLRSAVGNLLTNAVIHGRSDGRARIEVSLHLVPVPDSDSGGAAVLTVDDHGPGVPPAGREKVFERFHRGQDSPGSGLGLTLVAQQIALHQGSVRVVDRPDGRPGARFEVCLPITGIQNVRHTLPLLRRDWLTTSPDGPTARIRVRRE